MGRQVIKHLLADPMVPMGTVLSVGLDADAALAVWVEVPTPVDIANTQLLRMFTVITDGEFTGAGTYVGTVLVGGAETHVYNAGPL